MSLLGAHAFLWSAGWSPEEAARAVAGAAAAGFDLVEIPLLHPERVDVPMTRSLLAQHGLRCTCSLGLPPDAHMPSAPSAAERFLLEALDVVEALGSPALTGAPYCNLGTLTGRAPTAEELRTVVEVLKRVARAAANRGIGIGLEVINRYETYVLNTAEQARELVEAIGEPNVFVHLDTFHMNIEEGSFYEPIVALGERLGYVHLAESHRGVPGTGTVDFEGVFRGLRDIGFDGPVVVEAFLAADEAIARATASWRDATGGLDRFLEGVSYLRDLGRRAGVL